MVAGFEVIDDTSPSLSSSQKRSSGDTSRASGCTGAGSRDVARLVGQRSMTRFASSSVVCRGRIRCGELHESARNSDFSATERRRLPWTSTRSTIVSRRRRRGGLSWATTYAISWRVDFFTIPTATFRILFVFLVMRHDRRFVLHFNVTANPTAQWTAQQTVEAFPYDEAPRFLLRDRDSIYGHHFENRIKNMDIEEVITGTTISMAESVR